MKTCISGQASSGSQRSSPSTCARCSVNNSAPAMIRNPISTSPAWISLTSLAERLLDVQNDLEQTSTASFEITANNRPLADRLLDANQPLGAVSFRLFHDELAAEHAHRAAKAELAGSLRQQLDRDR